MRDEPREHLDLETFDRRSRAERERSIGAQRATASDAPERPVLADERDLPLGIIGAALFLLASALVWWRFDYDSTKSPLTHTAAPIAAPTPARP